MITAWTATESGLASHAVGAGEVPPEAIWIDAVGIDGVEEQQLATLLGVELPTHAQMQELTSSSRLYRTGTTVFMTATMLIKTATPTPEIVSVTFILTPQRLLTLRYADPWSFRVFSQRAPRCAGLTTPGMVFVSLLETTTERLADLLGLVAVELEHLSTKIFAATSGQELNLQRALSHIGRSGNILSKVRESLVDKNRIVIFAEQAIAEISCAECRARMHTLHRDIISLSDQATFTAGKISFMLDANLGLINIEQNRIIKIFSIVAVVFMPPTLIASIYGMNFKGMPELEWRYGYEYGIAMMVASVVATLWYFKRKRWV